MIGEHVKPGVSTMELDEICNDFIVNTQKQSQRMLVIEVFLLQHAHQLIMLYAMEYQ